MEPMLIRRNRILILSTLAALLSLLLLSGTLAYWVSNAEAVHSIDTPTLDGELVEIYDPPATVEPGMTIQKIVNVQNVGETDMLIRVKVTKEWGSSRDEDGVLIEDPTLDTDDIEIEFDDTYWTDGGDGYFYYKDILKTGEITVQPLFDSFHLKEDMGNEYKNKLADVVVSLECIQAGGGAAQVWDKTYAELGVEEPQSPEATTTQVILDEDGNFTFSSDSTDLFENFKDLLPGESRTQIINLQNNHDDKVEMFLRAVEIDQDKATEEQINEVRKLLEQHAQIVIKDGDGNVIYQGAVWGNPNEISIGNDSMRDYISLGSFDKGQAKDLTVELKLDETIGNEYQDLVGLIKWEFLAQAVDEDTPTHQTDENPVEPDTSKDTDKNTDKKTDTTDKTTTTTKKTTDDSSGSSSKKTTTTTSTGTTTDTTSTVQSSTSPKTGDNTNLYLWIISALTACAAIGIIWFAWKKMKKDIE
jgi:hypothetical protein